MKNAKLKYKGTENNISYAIILIVMEVAKKITPFEKRIHEIDLIRGFLILLVVLDHIFYCIQAYGFHWFGESHWTYQIFGYYWNSTARMIIQPLAVGLFCFISGVSTGFSKNYWKRTIIMVAFWLIIALSTNIIQLILNANDVGTNLRVDFNIIGCLSVCSLVYCLLQKRSWKGILAAFLISFLFSTYFIPMLRTGLYNVFGGYHSNRIGASYDVPNVYFILFWEYPKQADYVPLFPFLMFFLGGVLVSHFFYREKRQSLFPRRNWEKPICFVGRHTLIIYLAHFIIIRGAFIIVNLIMTGGFY